jgi:hypothetical protein
MEKTYAPHGIEQRPVAGIEAQEANIVAAASKKQAIFKQYL